MSTAADGLVRRPGPGDLAGAAFRLARSHYRCLLAAAAVALAPCLALGGWALDSYRSGASRASSSTELLAVLGALVIALGGLLAVGTGVHAAVSAAVGGVADWRESVRVAAARVGPLFSGACAIVILGFLGLVCFVAPGIYLWFAWFVAMPAIVIERRGGWDAQAVSPARAGAVVDGLRRVCPRRGGRARHLARRRPHRRRALRVVRRRERDGITGGRVLSRAPALAGADRARRRRLPLPARDGRGRERGVGRTRRGDRAVGGARWRDPCRATRGISSVARRTRGRGRR